MSTHLPAKPSARRIIRIMGSTVAQVPHRIPIALQLVLGLLILIASGTVLLMLPGAATRPLTILEAMFTATSAAAVTGLALFPTSTTFTLEGQVILMVLAQVGGVSLIVAVALIFRLFGRRVSLGERLAVVSSLGLDKSQDIAVIMVRATALMFTIEGIGSLFLFLHWRLAGIVPAGQAAFYALFHALMSFCNAGFDLFSGLPQYPQGIPSDPLSLLIMGILVILGGLGIPIYMDLIYRRRRRRLSLHTRVTLAISLILILVGWAGLLISEYRQQGVLAGMSPLERITLAWFQSVSARTAGFASLPGFNQLRFDSILLLMVLMFIGTAPASTGGGITTGTFVVLLAAITSYARGREHVRIGKRTLSDRLLLRAAVVLVVSLTLVIVATWLLLLTNGFSLSESLFEVVSAFSTTGLSLGITGSLNVAGRLIIMVMMFCGRLGAITLMIALLGQEPRQRLVEYPEESILIG